MTNQIFKDIEDTNKEIALLQAQRNNMILTYCTKHNIDYPEFVRRFNNAGFITRIGDES